MAPLLDTLATACAAGFTLLVIAGRHLDPRIAWPAAALVAVGLGGLWIIAIY